MYYYKVLEDTTLQGSYRIQNLQTKKNYIFSKEEKGQINKVSNILVEGERDTVYPDMVQNPILLVSEPLRKLLGFFDEEITFKIAVLTHLRLKKQKVYYIPFLEQLEALSEQTTYLKNDIEGQIVLKRERIEEKHLFYVKGARMTHLFISNSLAESMLRRGFIGFKLERVEVVG